MTTRMPTELEPFMDWLDARGWGYKISRTDFAESLLRVLQPTIGGPGK